MKSNSIYDIGKEVKVITVDDIYEIVKSISDEAWINKIPYIFTELLNGDYDTAIKSIKYIPNIYFTLNDDFRKDKYMKKLVVKIFKKNNRHYEIYKKNKMIMKRV